MTYGVLPGGLDYLHIRKPGRRIKYDVQLSDSDHGRELITGSVESGNYFRLHVNQYRSVETVTCLVRPDKVKIPVANFLRLYGLHERYLNNLVSRYDEGLISDFYLYFKDPWATAIFHDRFQDFRQEVSLFNFCLICRHNQPENESALICQPNFNYLFIYAYELMLCLHVFSLEMDFNNRLYATTIGMTILCRVVLLIFPVTTMSCSL